MNIDMWENELTVYKGTSVDDGEQLMLWENKENLCMIIPEDSELVKEDDGYGRTFYIIRKVKEDDITEGKQKTA